MEEVKHKKFISYDDAIRFFGNNYVDISMKILNEDNDWHNELIGNRKMITGDESKEITKISVTDASGKAVLVLTNLFPELCYCWSKKLSAFLLLTTHTGTSWKYVPVEVNYKSKYIEDYIHLMKWLD